MAIPDARICRGDFPGAPSPGDLETWAEEAGIVTAREQVPASKRERWGDHLFVCRAPDGSGGVHKTRPGALYLLYNVLRRPGSAVPPAAPVAAWLGRQNYADLRELHELAVAVVAPQPETVEVEIGGHPHLVRRAWIETAMAHCDGDDG